MKYSIIIPTYNHCNDLLKPCLESIFRHTDLQDTEIIISANGCTDNTKEYLEELKQKFEDIGFEKNFLVVWTDKALGYSKANNAGLRLAHGSKILLLNNDIVLLPQEKNTWINMLEAQFIQNPTCGISCVLKIHSQPADRDFAVFFCVMIDKKVFDRIGFLNEEYGKGGGEDTEFCIEAENVGFTVHRACDMGWSEEVKLHTGTFPIYHAGEGTVFDKNLVPDWQEVFYRNSIKLAKKYNPSWLGEKDYKKDLAFLKNNIDNFYDEVVCGDEYKITTDGQMKDRNVLDVGANIGSFSVLAAYMGAKKVVAVEPVSSVYNMLLDNSKNFSAIMTIKSVVTDKVGEIHSISLHDFSGVNSLYNVEGNSEEVSSTNLSELLKHFEGDNIFFKCDCEGAEYDIILNASQEEMNRINRIVLEIHMDTHPVYKGAEIIENKLKEFGFTLDDAHQIFSWKVDAQGNKFDYKEIPFKVEYWSRHA